MMIKNKRNGLFLFGVVLGALFVMLDISVFLGFTQSVDRIFFYAVNQWNPSPIFNIIMISLSLYGRELVWGGLVIVFLLFGNEKQKKNGLILLILFIILLATGVIVKTVDFRLRPYDALSNVRLLVSPEMDSSFPSGHTLIVVGGAIVSLIRMNRKWAFLLSVEATLVSFSRVYVGVHYPTDVLGSALLGTSGALILCSKPELIDKVYQRFQDIFGKSRARSSVTRPGLLGDSPGICTFARERFRAGPRYSHILNNLPFYCALGCLENGVKWL
jgi:undecaprenyl-diphosphatase